MPRTKPSAERRADLLDAAEAVFVGKGIAAATVDDITQRAGVAKGTFYLYFRTKTDIVSALRSRFGERFAERLTAAAAGHDDWGGKLDAFVTAWFDDYGTQFALHDVLFHHNVPLPADSTEHSTQPAMVTAIQRVLDAGVAAGAYNVEDTHMTATLFYGAIHEAFEAGYHTADLPAARLIRTTQQLLRRTAALPDPT